MAGTPSRQRKRTGHDRDHHIYDGKTHLFRIVDRAAAGADIVIARVGKPLVRLIPVEPLRRVPPPQLAGLPLPDDMLAPMTEAELAEWE